MVYFNVSIGQSTRVRMKCPASAHGARFINLQPKPQTEIGIVGQTNIGQQKMELSIFFSEYESQIKCIHHIIL
jgi:hypothetical protein